MEREKESFKVWTDASRRIVYSRGHGVAHAHEIEWLYENLVDEEKGVYDENGNVTVGDAKYLTYHKNGKTARVKAKS